MIRVYKGVFADKIWLVASNLSARELHARLGIPYYSNKKRNKTFESGLRTSSTDRDAKFAAPKLNMVFSKPIGGASAWAFERMI